VLVERSAPNNARPRASTAIEDRLAEIDRHMAGLYASMEDLEDRVASINERLDVASAIVIATNAQDDISAVTHLDELSRDLSRDIDKGSERIQPFTLVGDKGRDR
jgi:hypothetical protein